MNFLQEIFGWIAFILNIIFYIIPIPHFIKVIQGKLNFEDTPGVYVTTCYMNTFVWFIYGEMTSSDQIKVSNMLASIISFTFIMIYLLYELKKYFVDSVLNFLILISGSWAVYRALTIVVDDDITCGYIGLGTTVLVLISPLVILYKVCKEKNYHLIQVFSAFIYSLNSIFWFIYSIFNKDFYLGIASIIGFFASILQIGVFIHYRRKYGIRQSFSSSIDITTGSGDESKKEEIPIRSEEDKVIPVKIINKLDN